MDMYPTDLSLQASVIIPTHNRGKLLEKTLDALWRQTLPAQAFEVIVVADGCTDGTPEAARLFGRGLNLRVIEQPASGPAAARNRGAAEAQAELLIFLDDDILAQPQCLEAHVRAHQGRTDLVLIGYLPPLLQEQKGFYRAELFDWWEANFQRLRAPGYRFKYSDLTSGNFSLRKDLFQAAGAFNPDFWCHEDYELCYRLQRLNAAFDFSLEAAGFHDEWSGVDRSMERKVAEGIADVQLGRLYPELRPTFLMVRLELYAALPSRILKVFAFRWPAAGDALMRLLRVVLDGLDRLGLLRLWQRVLYGLLAYSYWRGVAKEMKTLAELQAFLEGVMASPAGDESLPEFDLANGIDAAEQFLDQHRPEGIRLCYREHVVGCLRPEAGSERLRGGHLRPALAGPLKGSFLRALVFNRELELPEGRDRLIELCNEFIESQSLYAPSA
jgi:glycosyltransferase involved in cell wall biosynthesis